MCICVCVLSTNVVPVRGLGVFMPMAMPKTARGANQQSNTGVCEQLS